ncbi:LOW QUALITY PROTEIN: hypothetical protein RJ641_020550 [Dillenia turbinata]|uniref:Uncharacterized protein n=1 Tax=Dillenia turbinata TaxID=194707 RepID=A0AAN8UT25_9MAGN
MMLPPSYHPSFKPSCLIPNPRDRKAHAKRMTIVVSLNASYTKLKKLMGGGFLYLAEHIDSMHKICRAASDAIFLISFKNFNKFFHASTLRKPLHVLLFYYLRKCFLIYTEKWKMFLIIVCRLNVNGNIGRRPY